ncbi:acyl-coenzyme A diphosphatase NUDT19 isoform X2 [Leptidea sinapis]|uniref:acyl-coenzyme A diphosphatase NUDT19 isoform X2 n=1 Tax=Leptidea sinapis TaxID=189913 RepID=UPI0021C39469|nr:acyl-coenzyme A diphosphatase NUDT19 isoform X2 [Leptidea sinapis]
MTRTLKATFSNGVVFPGGITEVADASDNWLTLFKSFGYTQQDFESFSKKNFITNLIFKDNPIQKHITLRITAIRETFEELGLLICSSYHKDNTGKGICTKVLPNVDTKYWQSKVSREPLEFLNLCKAYNCYPDIWSLHYWSNWLSPVFLPKRFDTAFFVAALEDKPEIVGVEDSQEVAKVEWSHPLDILKRNSKNELQLYPPQGYELHRFNYFTDVEEIITFAKDTTSRGSELIYPITVKTSDGVVFLLPGDHLYPADIDYNSAHIKRESQSTLKLRDHTKTLHRFEVIGSEGTIVVNNYTPLNHINMENQVKPVNISFTS